MEPIHNFRCPHCGVRNQIRALRINTHKLDCGGLKCRRTYCQECSNAGHFPASCADATLWRTDPEGQIHQEIVGRNVWTYSKHETSRFDDRRKQIEDLPELRPDLVACLTEMREIAQICHWSIVEYCFHSGNYEDFRGAVRNVRAELDEMISIFPPPPPRASLLNRFRRCLGHDLDEIVFTWDMLYQRQQAAREVIRLLDLIGQRGPHEEAMARNILHERRKWVRILEEN